MDQREGISGYFALEGDDPLITHVSLYGDICSRNHILWCL
jgi:hypothetical protein